MYCPHCGQLQTTGAVRFCSRCGFPLDGVIYLLGNGGLLPAFDSRDEAPAISARRRGVKQGGLLFLSGAVIVPLLAVLGDAANSAFLNLLMTLAAIICFAGGPLRMLYAGIFEEGAPNPYRQVNRPFSADARTSPVRFPGTNSVAARTKRTTRWLVAASPCHLGVSWTTERHRKHNQAA